jgi:hypothetical protein
VQNLTDNSQHHDDGATSEKSAASLKKKTLLCSTEAAVISIGLHLALLLGAGSIVAIQYQLQAKNNQIQGTAVAKQKMERRALEMPVKTQQLQKKSSRPVVTTRMATAGQTAFTLPDMSALAGVGEIGFGGGGGGSGDRDLKSLGKAGTLGFAASSVDFFGPKSTGEKLVFVIDASSPMLWDERGGYYTYRYVKDRLGTMIDGMNPATLFNVIVWSGTDGNKTVMFRPQPVPATPENRAALKAWIAPLNVDASSGKVGRITIGGAEYVPTIDYEDSVVKTDAKLWLRPVQAAFEQTADNVFVLGCEWGQHLISSERQKELFGAPTPEEEQKWLASKGWSPERIAQNKAKYAEYKARAAKILEDENKARLAKGQPPKVIEGDRDMYNYIYKELKFPALEEKPQWANEFGRPLYEDREIIEHLNTVYEYQYLPKKLPKPKLFFVKLIAADGDQTEGGVTSFRNLAQAFKGKFEFLRGAKTVEDLLKYNSGLREEK